MLQYKPLRLSLLEVEEVPMAFVAIPVSLYVDQDLKPMMLQEDYTLSVMY